VKTNIITFVGATALIVALVIGFAIVRPVLAQVAATSTDSGTSTSAVDTTATSTPPTGDVSTSAAPATTPESVVPSSSTSSPATSTASSPSAAPSTNTEASNGPEAPPPGLTEVHIIGTKYTDYFTDDAGEHSFPGDPTIDTQLSEKDALTPTHQGMTWEHTTGQNLYDTLSGDLEPGDYAVQANGSFLTNQVFVSSTSTSPEATVSTTSTP
jgi:hypothetical protein